MRSTASRTTLINPAPPPPPKFPTLNQSLTACLPATLATNNLARCAAPAIPALPPPGRIAPSPPPTDRPSGFRIVRSDQGGSFGEEERRHSL